MANLKRFTLADPWKSWQLTLEVDLDILTDERATEINEFWVNAEGRLEDQDGDVIRAVVKMAAERLVFAFLENWGVFIDEDGDSGSAAYWTRLELHEQEGWGGSEEDSAFGWCGIRLVSADVRVDLDLEF